MKWCSAEKLPDCLDTAKCYLLVDSNGEEYLAKAGLTDWRVYTYDGEVPKWIPSKSEWYGLVTFIKYRACSQADIDRLKRKAYGR